MFTFTEAQMKELLGTLGLPAECEDPDLALATAADMSKASVGDPVALASRAGLTTIDPVALTALQAEAQEARTLKAAAAQQAVSVVVETAIEKGKIPPARKQHWMNLITNDPELGKVLTSMPEGVIPTTEIGHSVEPDEGSGDQPWF